MKNKEEQPKKCPISWWKRIGYLGFWFFMFKGIAWLLGIAVIYIWGSDIFDNAQSFILNLLN